MIWLNPWAWAGLAGVALPVLVHLLARGHARVYRFPTLRFLGASRLLPTRRTRIQDAALLALRCGVIVLACAALAQPLLLTGSRRQTLDRGLARAIVVDTSASMRRTTSRGGLAADSARREARALAESAQASTVIESNDPAGSLRAAIAWLATQARRSELIVISDFQFGQLDSTDLRAVPVHVGVRLARIAVVDSGVAERRAAIGGNVVAARTTKVGNRTDVTWMATGQFGPSDALLLLGADADRATLAAVGSAAATVAVALPTDSSRRLAIVFPHYAQRSALTRATQASYAPWMVDFLRRLEVRRIRVARSGVADVGGRSRLVLFTDSAPATLAAPQLAALAAQATSVAPTARELDPAVVSDAALATWRRPAADVPSQLRPGDREGPSDARWLWIGALVLLLIEQWVRRAHAIPRPVAEERARAA